jgi:hypothetical protein
MCFGGALANGQAENKAEQDEAAVAKAERFMKFLRSKYHLLVAYKQTHPYGSDRRTGAASEKNKRRYTTL